MSMGVTPDSDWQAEMDARTLAEAEVIKNDKQRETAAKLKAKQMADRQAEETAALRKVAREKKNPSDARGDGMVRRKIRRTPKDAGQKFNIGKKI